MLYEYDLTSAYPCAATLLRDTSQCRFEKSSDYVKDADWGFLKGQVTIYPDVKVSPIMYWDGQRNICPTGTWDTTLTLQEVMFINKWGIGEFKLRDGWFLTFKSNNRPLNVIIERLYNHRSSGDLKARLAKSILVGIIGKTAEERFDGKYGAFFNPFYQSMVQAWTRLQVCEFIYKHKLQDNLVMVLVDCAMVDKPVNIPERRGMGTWRESYQGPGLIISTGHAFYGDKRPDGITYDAIMDAIAGHPSKSFYQIPHMRKTTLGEAVMDGADFNNLGVISNHPRTLDLNMLNPTRYFNKLPHTGRQLLSRIYESTPLEVQEGNNNAETLRTKVQSTT